jgi:hypothetical protein
MKRNLFFCLVIVTAFIYTGCHVNDAATKKIPTSEITTNADKMLTEGKQIFRFETFGDEIFWTDALQLDKAIIGEKKGGVVTGLSPKAALAAGLKVDMDAIPPDVATAIKAGKIQVQIPKHPDHLWRSLC